MDDNKQAMVEADEFDAETMMGMFNELRARQILEVQRRLPAGAGSRAAGR